MHNVGQSHRTVSEPHNRSIIPLLNRKIQTPINNCSAGQTQRTITVSSHPHRCGATFLVAGIRKWRLLCSQNFLRMPRPGISIPRISLKIDSIGMSFYAKEEKNRTNPHFSSTFVSFFEKLMYLCSGKYIRWHQV